MPRTVDIRVGCFLSTLIATWIIVAAALGDPPSAPRIDPQGIAGAMVLAGTAASEQAIERFVELAGGKRAHIAVIVGKSNEADADVAGRLLRQWQNGDARSIQFLRVDSLDAAREFENSQSLDDATAVWILNDDSDSASARLTETPLGEACAQVMRRGGVVGMSGSLVASVGVGVVRLDSDNAFKPQTLSWLPDAVIASAMDGDHEGGTAEIVAQNKRLVGYEIDENSAIVVRGRQIESVGEGAVRILLADGPGRPAKQITLRDKDRVADLTALRRAAADRAGGPFPPDRPQSPCVEHGTLIAIGGGGMPAGIVERFVELAGGDKASIILLPTANPDPVPNEERLAESFRRAGAARVAVLPGRAIDVVESDEYLAAFHEATGIWFGGGRQWRFVDAYLGTKAHELMHDVLRRGGVIMGSSAGASIQAEYMARGNPLGNLDIMADGYERGLGFLPGTAIDQHFAQRRRFRDMTSLVRRYPQILGIGIDESTALVVHGCIGEVVGRGSVHFYEAAKPVENGQQDYESVASGGKYDLATRKVLGNDQPEADEEAATPVGQSATDN